MPRCQTVKKPANATADFQPDAFAIESILRSPTSEKETVMILCRL